MRTFYGSLAALVLLAALALPSSPLRAAESIAPPQAGALVCVDTDTVLVKSTMGVGVQWDPSDLWDLSAAQWKTTLQRVDFMKPGFIRCCLTANFYCTGFDAAGSPVYDWESVRMKRLYRILDYCQAQHVDVLIGEWGPAFGMKWDDPRWSKQIADCLDYLVRKRGYTCIRWYNKVNEPHGGWDAYLTWKAGQQSLRAELDRRGLLRQIGIVGPDHSEGRTALEWVEYMVKESPGTFDAYETHWYAGSASEIPNGEIEKVMRHMREVVNDGDPNGKSKLFFMGESGTGEWLNGDSNRYIRDFVYGVFMSDYLAQTMRAGLAGQSAWMLDDIMHQQPGSGTGNGLPSGNAAKDFNFKVWGFWNSLGTVMGKPGDEKLRPWFYTWSLLGRSFPRGCRIIRTADPHLPGVRTAAALVPHGRESDVSLLVVNDSKVSRTIHLTIPNASSAATLLVYDYFENDRPTDADGFPVAKRVLKDVRLRSGMDVALPSQGVVILTTLDGGSPVELGSGAPIPVTSVILNSPDTQVGIGDSLQFSAVTEPLKTPVRWRVDSLDGASHDLAAIDSTGRLTCRKLGKVRVTVFAGDARTPVTAQAIVDLVPLKSIFDPLDDWSKSFAHSENWTFESINTNLFEGDPSRAKRTKDSPENIVYHCPGIDDFTARVYFAGDFTGKVKAYASADNAAWVPVILKNDPPIPTEWQFKRTNVSPVSLPAGTSYLKIEFASDPLIFSPQLGEVRLYHQ